MEQEFIFKAKTIQNEINTSVNGKWVKNMERAICTFKIRQFILVNLQRINFQAKDLENGILDKHMMVAGKMGKCMVQVHS